MSNRETPCKDRVAAELEQEQASMKKLIEQVKDLADWEIDACEEYREPLSVDIETTYNILLSWGGPADGYKVIVKDKEVSHVVYWIAGWFDYAEQRLSEEEEAVFMEVYRSFIEGFLYE